MATPSHFLPALLVSEGFLGAWVGSGKYLGQYRRDPHPTWMLLAPAIPPALKQGRWLGRYLVSPACLKPTAVVGTLSSRLLPVCGGGLKAAPPGTGVRR